MGKKTLLSLTDLSKRFSEEIGQIHFSSPVRYVYNPLDYAWKPHAEYTGRFGSGKKKVLFVGMNPGPWGMVQNGIPFGDIYFVKEWFKIEESVTAPAVTHPDRPVLGFNSTRSEQSGQRLWGLMRTRFLHAETFFQDHFVTNYCPLAFFDIQGKNITPNTLNKKDRDCLHRVCDTFLLETIRLLMPRFVIGIGKFAEERIHKSLLRADSPEAMEYSTGSILHPSPANPAANTDWAGKATRQLIDLGVWEE
ncbi:MAG: single-stranded DNA-binding protein [Spirochaetales bacterium]|nr:single-stranded DNA-binding protein [Spirochaetales bacterium]